MLKSFKKNYAIIIFITVIMLLAVSVEVLGRTYNINDRFNDELTFTEELVKEYIFNDYYDNHYDNYNSKFIDEILGTAHTFVDEHLEMFFEDFGIDFWIFSKQEDLRRYISDRLEESGKLTDVLAAIEEAETRIFNDVEEELSYLLEELARQYYYDGRTEIGRYLSENLEEEKTRVIEHLEEDGLLTDLVDEYLQFLIDQGLWDLRNDFDFESIIDVDGIIEEKKLELKEFADLLYEEKSVQIAEEMENDIYEIIDNIIDEIDI